MIPVFLFYLNSKLIRSFYTVRREYRVEKINKIVARCNYFMLQLLWEVIKHNEIY